jgi:hypothetical protein
LRAAVVWSSAIHIFNDRWDENAQRTVVKLKTNKR